MLCLVFLMLMTITAKGDEGAREEIEAFHSSQSLRASLAVQEAPGRR